MTLHFILALFLLAGGWRYLKDLWSAIAGNGRFDSVSWHWQSIEWPPTRTYLTTLLPCALATALDIGLSNTSLKFISLSMYTMMKSTTPAFVLLVAFLFRLEPVERRLLAVIVLLCGGAALMGQRPEECYRTSLPTAVICPPPGSGDSVDDYDYDYDHHHPHPHQGNDDDSSSRRFWIGLTCVLIASAMSGVRWALTQILLHRGQGRNIDDDNSHQNNPTETSSSYRPITTITNTNTNTNTITNTNTNTNQISRWTGESRRQKNNRQDERIPLRTVASGDQLLGASRASGASSDGQSSENSDSDTDDRFVTPDDIWSEEKGGGENAQDNRLFDIPNNPSSSTNPINKRLATARDDGDSQMEPRSAAVNANQSENYPATSRSRSPPNDKRDRSINESPLESDDDDDYGGRGRGRGGTEEQSGQTQRRPGHPRQLYNIFLLSPIMAVLLLFASTLIEHPFSGGKQSENGGPMSDNAVAAFFMMLAGGLMAFMMILSEFWLISLTGAVTLSVAGMFKELLTILTAILLFKGVCVCVRWHICIIYHLNNANPNRLLFYREYYWFSSDIICDWLLQLHSCLVSSVTH